MYAKGNRKGIVRFVTRPAGSAGKVELAGSFNNWRPVPMRKQKDGTFAAEVPVPPGVHEYKFVVDGQWLADADNSAYVVNCYRTVNSVARVGA